MRDGLSVGEHDVQFWRRGITVPPFAAFNRIAKALDIDPHWLCTGQAERAHAAN